MLAVMLGFGVVSRLIFGWVLNRFGGLSTLLLGSTIKPSLWRFICLRRARFALRGFGHFRPGARWPRSQLCGDYP
jgi:hypothetical protein